MTLTDPDTHTRVARGDSVRSLNVLSSSSGGISTAGDHLSVAAIRDMLMKPATAGTAEGRTAFCGPAEQVNTRKYVTSTPAVTTAPSPARRSIAADPHRNRNLHLNAILAASESQRSMASAGGVRSATVSAEEDSEQSRQESQREKIESHQSLYRNDTLKASDSQRRLLADSGIGVSASSRSLQDEEQARILQEELDTQRIAEEAQEEEIMRLALERSITETMSHSGGLQCDLQSPKSASRQPLSSTDHSSRSPAEAAGLSGDDHHRPPAESITIDNELDDENDDDDDDISMFDMSPNEPATSARAKPMLVNVSGLPSSPPLLQSCTSTPGVVDMHCPAPTTGVDFGVPPRGVSPAASPTRSVRGATSVKSPAPKSKSPRPRTRDSFRSPSLDETSSLGRVGGTAVAVDSPAPSITKSSEVRAAIVKHVTSSELDVKPDPDKKEKEKEQAESSELSGMVAIVDESKSQSNPSTKPKSARNPWKTNFQEERKDSLPSGWPALGEQEEKSVPKDSFDPDPFGLSGANLSPEELLEIQRALGESADGPQVLGESPVELQDIERALRESQLAKTSGVDDGAVNEQNKCSMSHPADAAGFASDYEFSEEEQRLLQECSREDATAIAAALLEMREEEAAARREREVKEEEERKSLELALQMQKDEERRQYSKSGGSRNDSRKVRTITRAELREHGMNAGLKSCGLYPFPDLDEEDRDLPAGFRMNSSVQQQWSRLDQNIIVGPNRELRTKHDTTLDGEANAHRLGLEASEAGIGNKAYNSFMQSMKGSKKGVAKAGTGRAGSDTDATKSGALDPKVRSVITQAINDQMIEKCNGAVKEGKEAVVYHADQGEESEGFDVAIKVFKRIQEFRGRGEYVDGDPRYGKSKFSNNSNREQLEVWTEKEFRNLMKANKAGVPVPSPLRYKENVLFMRFLGNDGRPAPQLRELNLREGSSKWTSLYIQVVEAIKR